MTDWLPWGLVFAASVFATLGTLLRAMGQTPPGAGPDLKNVWRTFWIGATATAVVYLVYVVFQERWIWY